MRAECEKLYDRFLGISDPDLSLVYKTQEIQINKAISNMKKDLFNLEEIGQFLNRFDFVDLSLFCIYKKYKENFPLSDIGYGYFKKHCSNLGFSFKAIQENSKNSKFGISPTYNYLNGLMNLIEYEDCHLLFFDVSAISDKSFKKRSWNLPYKITKIHKLYRYDMSHILCAMSLNGIEGIQIIKGNLINFDLIDFLKMVIKNYRQRRLEPLHIILDNAKMHKTAYFQNYLVQQNVFLHYTVSNKPFYNPIEYAFRFLKSKLKKRYSMSR